MVSSSLDKNNKKTLQKDTFDLSETINGERINNIENRNTIRRENLDCDQLPSNDKIQLMFPKCKPRNEYQYQTSAKTSQDIPITITSFSSSQSAKLINTQANSSAHNLNMNNRILMKLHSPISPDHKTQQHLLKSQFSEHAKNLKSNIKHESNDNYVETNPFRIGSNKQYFHTPNNSLYDNNNSSLAASNNNSMMDQYHYPPLALHGYQTSLEDRSYFLESDEIDHNPYTVYAMGSSHNTIPSSILKTSPPATPPALTTPRTTPVDTSLLESNRNIWDLSPIKTTTPSRIKTQSPITAPFSRTTKGSYKKLLASPIPIEEDLESGHFYYNNKKSYYQTLQTDNDLNEPATIQDVQEIEGAKQKSLLNKSKMQHSESNDFLYADVKKNEDKKIVKSKSGSGIMGKAVYILVYILHRFLLQTAYFYFRV